jgi:N-acetylmuramoyl-L-alanine amidase
MRRLDEIVVHCTATHAGWRGGDTTAARVAEVRRWHVQDNGWSDIGYHYLIDRDGTIATGRPIVRAGAHVAGRNAHSVGVALFGGHGSAATDDFHKHFTIMQEQALRRLIASLMADYPSIRTVSGHNQYAAKACPGFSVPKWWPQSPVLPPDVEPVPAAPVPFWRSWWASLTSAWRR